MITMLKLAGISAVLSAGLVTAFEASTANAVGGKPFQDRLPIETAAAPEVLRVATAAPVPSCRDQAWPYVSTECAARPDGASGRKVVRTITIERRDAPNTSTLLRVPVGP